MLFLLTVHECTSTYPASGILWVCEKLSLLCFPPPGALLLEVV